MRRWPAELALLPSGVAAHVLIQADGRAPQRPHAGHRPYPDATHLPGLTIPAWPTPPLARLLPATAGADAVGGRDFWSWRRRMYELAGCLNPDGYLALATAVYAEMALASVTAVGEFHYLHHDPEGRRYADPNEMGLALRAAAAEAGIRLSLIDACYLRATSRAARWKGRRCASATATPPPGPTGSGSSRAARPCGSPPASTACGRCTRARCGWLRPGRRRVGAAAPAPVRAARRERGVPGGNRADAGGAGRPLRRARPAHHRGPRHLAERLATGRRGLHRPAALLAAAPAAGMAAIGWPDAGRLEADVLADFATLDLTSPRLAGAGPDELVDQVVFAATAADVTHVVVGGRPVLEERRHLALGRSGGRSPRRSRHSSELGRRAGRMLSPQWPLLATTSPTGSRT
jgi:hypothetical protein